MNDDPIRQLLKRADDAAPPPARDGDIAGRVRRRIRRRRTAVVVISSAAVLLISVAILKFYLPVWHNPHRPTVAGNGSSSQTQPPIALVDLIELNAEAALHAQMAERLWAAERQRQKLARAQNAPDPLAAIERGRDRAALISFDRADQLTQQREFPAAAREYQQTIKLFPNTHWAAVARQRLAQNENRKEG